MPDNKDNKQLTHRSRDDRNVKLRGWRIQSSSERTIKNLKKKIGEELWNAKGNQIQIKCKWKVWEWSK